MKRTTGSVALSHRLVPGFFLATLMTLSLAGLVSNRVQAQTFTVLYKFKGARDGAHPYSRLVVDDAGNLYGTAYRGGAYGFGTVFKLTPNGEFSILHTFTGLDGLWPSGDLFRDKNGNLYGTTEFGAISEGGKCRHGCGVLFKLDLSGKYRILHKFHGDEDGGAPLGRLIRDGQGISTASPIAAEIGVAESTGAVVA